MRYEGEIFDLWLNVGVAKNDKKNHLYAITNQNEHIKEKKRPPITAWSRPVGNAIQNASSNNSIPQKSEKSTENAKKSFSFDPDTFIQQAMENGGMVEKPKSQTDTKKATEEKLKAKVEDLKKENKRLEREAKASERKAKPAEDPTVFSGFIMF